MNVMELIEDPEFSRRFPAERWARVRIALRDGTTLESEPAVARGNPENPLPDDEIIDKYRVQAGAVLGDEPASRLLNTVVEANGSGSLLAPAMELLYRAP